MSDLRTRIAAALYARAIERLGWNRSWDNLGAPSQQLWLDDADAVLLEFEAHLADAVIAALGIREVAHCDECDHRRIISEWSD